METVFNENYRDFLPKKYDLSEIDITSEKLLLDHKGISVMSTHAMNFLYLYNKFFKQNSDFSIIKKVSTIIEQEYELTEKEDINNLLYLSTHCIINETLFYYKNIESAKLSEAKNLIINTEHLIKDHLDNIKIDGLFEFLICCKFVGHKSKLEKYIFDRAVSQYSSQKGFIKNPHKKTEIGKSEHRNVLFILLFKEFVSA
ncbi:MAG: hypothetical protein RBS56_04430 [Candidatus Gracilibacteria bacterium]|nr:hypothetical protein [Candidatus Gracilibacteria bacterium]